ncbi:outer membrane beta-barrel protein [Candidatus Thioglobus sp.]|nr:outer membrane beta-barrel protein [Candidatus Thioglobus sp.]MDC0388502.1 outer membrane beta-barrel protein [Candidatus Thioglobus sp.]
MKKQLNTAIAALFLATASMAVNATTDDNWYGYIGMQNSELDLNASDVGGVSLDDDGMHVGIGYKVNDNFAFEGGYLDMNKLINASGSWSVNSAVSGTYAGNSYSYTSDLAGTVDVSAEVYGWTFGGIYSTPVSEKIDAFAKAGIYKWDGTARLSGTLTAGTLTVNGVDYTTGAYDTASATASGTDTYFGVGGTYDLTPEMDIRADYSKYKIDSEKVNVTGLTLVTKF